MKGGFLHHERFVRGHSDHHRPIECSEASREKRGSSTWFARVKHLAKLRAHPAAGYF